MKLGGRMMSGTLVLVVMVTVLGRGLVMVRQWEMLWRTAVSSLMVLMIPGGVDLKVTL